MDKSAKTYIDHLHADTRCRLEDVPRAMVERERERERERGQKSKVQQSTVVLQAPWRRLAKTKREG